MVVQPLKNQAFAAIDSRWVSANAGSGKTRELIERVLKLLLLGVPAERILCITYTKAAAAEMRHRLVDKLRDFLLVDDAKCRELFEASTGCVATADSVTHARSLFTAMLDSATGGVELTTIHGFCQRILRAFQLEAEIVPYFSVLEEAETSALMAQASHEVLQDATHEPLASALALLVDRTPEFTYRTLATTILNDRAHWDACWRNQTLTTLKAHVSRAHDVAIDTTQEALLAAWSQRMAVTYLPVLREAIDPLAAHTAKQRQLLATALAQWCEAEESVRFHTTEALMTALLTKEGEVRDWLRSDRQLPSSVKTALLEFAEHACALIAQQSALSCAQESMAVAVLAQALIARYQHLKTRRHAFDYDDLIAHTVALFTQRDMAAWVMSKLDHRIDHVLIDEAQDTSSGQWAIARALVEELVAQGISTSQSPVPRSVFVVGDEKQSIFSFQGANPRLFADEQQRFTQALAYSAAPMVAQQLAVTHRTAPAILRVVDALASLPEVATALSAQGQVTHHRTVRSHEQGRVMLYPALEKQEKPAIAAFVIPQTYQVIRSQPAMLAESIAAEIRRWLDEKRMLVNQGRALRPGDILILVHRRRPLMPALIRALQREHIEVSGIDRLVLAEHLAVKDILALMRWVVSPHDDLALAQVLRSPLVGISEDALCELAAGRGEVALWQVVRSRAAVRVSQALARWQEACQYSPHDFLALVLETDGARQRFAERFGDEIHEVLDELQEQAASMPEHMVGSLENFEAHIRHSDREIKREMDVRANRCVRLMTVHGAKGLEAPVVILADTVTPPTLRHEQIFSITNMQGNALPVLRLSKQAAQAPVYRQAKQTRLAELQAEYLRLLYVAMTRARDELHIFAAEPAKPQSWYEYCQKALVISGATQAQSTWVLMDAAPAAAPCIDLAATQELKKAETVVPDWVAKAPPPPRALPVRNPSQMAESTPMAFGRFSPQQARLRGVHIHRLLECLTPTSSQNDMLALLHSIAPEYEPAQRQAMVTEVYRLHQQEGWLWQCSSYAEVSMSGTLEIGGQKVAVHGQVDRLVRKPNEWVIVDYKTAHQVPLTAEEVPLSYLLQLKTYAALLSQIYPDTPIACAIIWTSTPQCMWVTQQVNHAAWIG